MKSNWKVALIASALRNMETITRIARRVFGED